MADAAVGDCSPITMNASSGSELETNQIALLNRRDFRLYLFAIFFASLGSAAQSVAVSWQIYDITRSAIALGYVGLAQFFPMVALALPGGDLADRYNRRTILALGYAVQAACACMFLALAIIHYREPLPFYFVLAMFGTARALVQPAAQSFLPRLVDQDQFPQAVALSSSARQIATIAGPALGGFIYILGASAAYAMCLFLFAMIAIAVAFIRTPGGQTGPPPRVSSFQRLTAGILYIRTRPVILGAISLDLFAVLLGGATALLPIYARDILHVGPAGLGLLRSAPAVGAAAIGLMLVHIPLGRRAGIKMFICVAIFGVATIAFGLSTIFIASLGALVILGAADMVSVYVRQTLVQLATPDAMRGRVSAVNFVFIGTSNELGEFESGLTAAWFGTVPAVVIGGVGTLAVVGIWMFLFPSLRRVDNLALMTPD